MYGVLEVRYMIELEVSRIGNRRHQVERVEKKILGVTTEMEGHFGFAMEIP